MGAGGEGMKVSGRSRMEWEPRRRLVAEQRQRGRGIVVGWRRRKQGVYYDETGRRKRKRKRKKKKKKKKKRRLAVDFGKQG